MCSQIHESKISVICIGMEGALECVSHGRILCLKSKAGVLLPPQGPWIQGQEWALGKGLCGEETQSVLSDQEET